MKVEKWQPDNTCVVTTAAAAFLAETGSLDWDITQSLTQCIFSGLNQSPDPFMLQTVEARIATNGNGRSHRMDIFVIERR
jgi:hypothetical protein